MKLRRAVTADAQSLRPSPDGVVSTASTGIRNGLPEMAGYRWRPGEADRGAQLAAGLAALRESLALIHAEIEEAP